MMVKLIIECFSQAFTYKLQYYFMKIWYLSETLMQVKPLLQFENSFSGWSKKQILRKS